MYYFIGAHARSVSEKSNTRARAPTQTLNAEFICSPYLCVLASCLLSSTSVSGECF